MSYINKITSKVPTDSYDFLEFIIKSGAKSIVNKALDQLSLVEPKPEDPREWFYHYFKDLSPPRNENFSISLEKAKEAMISKLTALEAKILRLNAEKNKLEQEVDAPDSLALAKADYFSKVFAEEDKINQNYGLQRCFIKPDPMFRTTVADGFLEILDRNKNEQIWEKEEESGSDLSQPDWESIDPVTLSDEEEDGKEKLNLERSESEFFGEDRSVQSSYDGTLDDTVSGEKSFGELRGETGSSGRYPDAGNDAFWNRKESKLYKIEMEFKTRPSILDLKGVGPQINSATRKTLGHLAELNSSDSVDEYKFNCNTDMTFWNPDCVNKICKSTEASSEHTGKTPEQEVSAEFWPQGFQLTIVPSEEPSVHGLGQIDSETIDGKSSLLVLSNDLAEFPGEPPEDCSSKVSNLSVFPPSVIDARLEDFRDV